MKFESPISRRVSIERGPTGLTIVVRAKTRLFVFAIALFWLVFCAIAALAVVGSSFEPPVENNAAVFLTVIWLCMWAGFSILPAIALLWMIWGKEQLVVSNKSLTKQVSIPVFWRNWHFDPSHIANFRKNQVARPMSDWRRPDNPLGKRGLVAFDYGQKTITFGVELDDAEADLIVNTLNDYFEPGSVAA